MARKARKSKAQQRPVPALTVDPASWPANTREQRAVAELVPYANNARTHSVSQIDQITAAIAKWGWTSPVLVDEGGNILAGHGRVLAAKRLGLTEVPVMVAHGWSAEAKRAYILADNKIAENAGWDKELLALELNALRDLPDIDFAMIGFTQGELDRLLAQTDREGQTDPNAIPPSAGGTVTRRGDMWLLGEHRILCGDCTVADDVALVLAGEKPQLMVTDPPYGVEYDPDWRNHAEDLGCKEGTTARATGKVENDDRADWRETWALFPGDVAYVWHGALHSDVVIASLQAVGFEKRAQIIWAKDGFVVSRGHYHWQHEPCWYVVRKGGTGHWAGDRSQSTLWEIPRPKKSETGHGTQKPIECMKRPILNNSREGDFVYEPFSGSGTTIIAAEQTLRRCLAIEINPVYVDVAVRRWEAFTQKRAILAGGQSSFSEVTAERLAQAA